MNYTDSFQSNSSDVTVLYAEEEHVHTNTVSGPLVRSVYIIECCIEGEGIVEINGKPFSIQAGDCYVLLPGCSTIFRNSATNPRGGYWCALEGFTVGKVLEKVGVTPESPFLPAALYEHVKFWLQLMAQHWSAKDAGAKLRQTGCAYGLLGALQQNRPAPDNAGIIEKLIGYMQTNYPEDLTLDTLARQAGLERTYFSFLFKQKTGHSPHSYLTQIRVRKACQLLGTRKHTVSEVADMVGLTPHNFSRQFRQVMGMTAKTYQQQLVRGRITSGILVPTDKK